MAADIASTKTLSRKETLYTSEIIEHQTTFTVAKPNQNAYVKNHPQLHIPLPKPKLFEPNHAKLVKIEFQSAKVKKHVRFARSNH